MNLLIIEDDPVVGPVLVRVFAADGHTVTLKTTAEDALDYLSSARPDAVFLDVKLPKLNGIAVLRRIRASDSDLPVVVITGHATGAEIAEAQELGVVDVLHKSELLDKSCEAFEKLRRRRRH